jgi:hypothetical protein
MLSKMLKPANEYVPPKHIDNLDKCGVKELKDMAKERGLRLSGKKEELKQRIQENMKQHKCATVIQRRFRGHMVKTWLQLKRGSNGAPVNESDFYTMEPINEMEFLQYLNYTEAKSNTSYVFNLHSLMSLVAKTGNLHNPYTREDMSKPLSQRLLKIIRLTNILFPDYDLLQEPAQTLVVTPTPTPALPIDPSINYNGLITELFIKIDELGNYTNVMWFLHLSNTQLRVLVLRLYHLWGHIETGLQRRICPTRNPFGVGNIGAYNVSETRSIAENRAIALRIGETMVYDGELQEHRTLGAMYFLTAMTVVSQEVRQAIPWLYENYFVITQP